MIICQYNDAPLPLPVAQAPAAALGNGVPDDVDAVDWIDSTSTATVVAPAAKLGTVTPPAVEPAPTPGNVAVANDSDSDHLGGDSQLQMLLKMQLESELKVCSDIWLTRVQNCGCDLDIELSTSIIEEIMTGPSGGMTDPASASVSLGVPSGQETWIQNVLDVIGEDLLCERLQPIAHSIGSLSYGSDCSGVDAPVIALKSLLKRLRQSVQDLE